MSFFTIHLLQLGSNQWRSFVELLDNNRETVLIEIEGTEWALLLLPGKEWSGSIWPIRVSTNNHSDA
jgi:hypothetical protein